MSITITRNIVWIFTSCTATFFHFPLADICITLFMRKSRESNDQLFAIIWAYFAISLEIIEGVHYCFGNIVENCVIIRR